MSCSSSIGLESSDLVYSFLNHITNLDVLSFLALYRAFAASSKLWYKILPIELTIASIPINNINTNIKNSITSGCSIKAGWLPDSIKNSASPAIKKNIIGILIQAGIDCLIVLRGFGCYLMVYC